MTTVAALPPPSHHATPTCKSGKCETSSPGHPCFSNPKVQMIMGILEKVTFVALTVLAFYMEPELTGYFAAGGFVIGLCMYWGTPPPEDDPKKVKPIGCSQGFLEEMTGLRLPPPLGLAANIAIFYHHLEHCSEVFAPLVGLNFGYKLGQMAGIYLPKYLPEFYNRFCCVRQ